MNKKLYVLVDANLSKSQQGVQAGHALAEYLLRCKTDWENGTLVYLKTYDLKKYLHLAEAVFREPDLNNHVTAIAALDIGALVKDLPLV